MIPKLRSPSSGENLENGAKETRTLDPLHAMQDVAIEITMAKYPKLLGHKPIKHYSKQFSAQKDLWVLFNSCRVLAHNLAHKH